MIVTKKLIPTLSLVLLILFSSFANPQSVYATCGPDNIIYVSPSGSNTDGCTWATAFTTLQSALAIAASGDQIWVAAGTYYPDEGAGQTSNSQASTYRLITGVAIYGGFNGTETLVTQRNANPATNSTILSGDIDQDGLDAENALNVVTIDGGGLLASYILDGFTITGGYEDSGSAFGGGLYIHDTSPTLSNLLIQNNFAASNGGGVYVFSGATVEASYSSPAFTNVTLSGNSAARGGGMYLQNASPTLTQVTFSGNSAISGAGGGINSQVLNPGSDEVSLPVLTDVTFSGNNAAGGGGMFVTYSNAILNRVTFSGNTATRRGGGILIEIASPSLTNVTFSGNISTETTGLDPRGGGGIMVVTGSPILNNVTFSGNDSLTVGGDAIRSATNSAPVIRNTIFWDDVNDEINSDGTGSLTIADSVIEGGCPVGATCTNIISTDPVLSALASNGGFTQTMAISEGGSAFNAGNNATCAATDQRGISRPQGSACDIGAYEVSNLAGPTLLSFARQTPASSPTNADTLVFRATFSTSVINVSIGDFLVNGTTTALVTNVNTISTSTYDITVSGGDLAGFNGTVGLDLSGSQDIKDTNNNALPAGEPATDETYLVDNIAPTVTLDQAGGQTDPTNSLLINFTAVFSEAVSGFSDSDVTLAGTAGPTTAGVTGGPTTYNVEISGMSVYGTVAPTIGAGVSTDAAGNSNLASTSTDGNVTYDPTAPDTSITDNPANPSNSSSASFSFTGSDAGGSGVASFQCKLDGAAFATCTSPRDYSNLINGSHTFQVRAIDNAGNTDASPASFTWTVDTAAPNTSITANPSDPTSSTLASFSFTGSDSGSGVASFECKLDSGTFGACTSPQNYSSLSDGLHTFDVRSIDNVGNTDPTPASFTWMVDTTAPETAIIDNPTNPGGASASFSFGGSDPGGSGVASFECKLDEAAFAACTSPQNLTSLSDGSHTFQVRAIDGAGNVDASPDSFTWTVDSNAPDTSITASPSDPSNSNSASFSFTGSDPGGSGVASFECKLDGAAFTACTSPRNYSSLSDGSHTFQVRAIDIAGNPDASPASFTWTVDTAAPDTSITANPSNPSSSTSASFSFTGSDLGSGVASFECKLDGAAFAACTSPRNYSNLSNGSHNFQVRAIDNLGNIDASPASFTWTVDTAAPNTFITASPSNPTNSNSASFSFTGSDPGGSGVASFECKLDGAAFTACTSPQNFTSLSDASHTFQVRAIDNAGNMDPSPASFTWTVDTVAPIITINNPSTAPAQSKTITASSSEGTLTMSNTTGSTCNGTLTFVAYASQTFTSEADNGKKVCYRAIDAAGNSTYNLSNAIAGIDTTAPVVTSLTVTSPTTSLEIPITAFTASDAVGVSAYMITTSAAIPSSGAASWSATAPSTYHVNGAGTYTLYPWAKDAAGNVSAVFGTGVPVTVTWVGGISISSDKNIVAVGRPHIGSEVASYGGFASGSLTSYIPMLFKGAFGSYDSALYIQNVHASNNANVTIKYYDSNGSLNCTKTDTIAPLSSKGYWVPTATCDSGLLPAGWVGGVVVTSDQPIVSVGRPHVGGEVMTYNGFASGSLSMYVPMLFKGAFGGSYNSAFYLQNTHASNTASITMEYYDSTGTLSCVTTDTIAPLASKGYWVPTATCDIGSLPDGWVGGVVVTSNQSIVAVGRPHIGAQVTTYNGFPSGGLSAFVPMLFKGAFGGSYNAAFYLQNADISSTANITIKYYDSNGILDCTKSDTIAPLASKGYWVPTAICDIGSLPDGWVGGVVVTSDHPIVAVGRPHLDAQVTTYNGFTSGSLNAYLPMLFNAAFGGSYNSAFYIQNTESSSAIVTIKLYDTNGVLNCTRSETIPALSTLGYWLPTVSCTP